MPLTAAEAAALALARREDSRIHEQSHLLLVWIRQVFPNLLGQSASLRGNLDSRSVDRLATLLSDGVVLADIVATLDPARLSPNAVRRFAPRNVFSAPISRPAPGAPPSNVDARQKTVQYNNNTRLVLAAVKKLLDVVRADANVHSVPGIVDHFVGNAPAVPPVRDIRPALRLAQLVLAAAVYGPDHSYRDVFWQLPTDSLRNSLHKCLTSVAQAVELPTPDLLYADGPASASALPDDQQPPSAPTYSQPSRNIDSNTPALPTASSAIHPSTPVTETPGAYNPGAPGPSTTPITSATAAAVASTTAATAVGAGIGAASLTKEAPQSTGVIELSRKHDAEAFAPPLVGEAALAHGAMLDDGMGGRKISLVTDDENNSRGSLSPLHQSSRSTDHGLSATDQFPGERKVDEHFVENINQHDQPVEQGGHSTTSSDDFFTPKEHTPGDHSPTEGVEDVSHVPTQGPSTQFAGVAPYHVDETVRHSVSTSITRHISVAPEFEPSDDLQEDASVDSSSINPSAREPRTLSGRNPIDFTNPAHLMSPSGSDAPEPSSQWQIYRQKTHVADVMSPQQLFSPPPMPRRLSRTTAATQMTPPQAAPILFRNGSPQLSVNSGEGNMFEDPPLLSKNLRVSFATAFQSPGSQAHAQSSVQQRTGSFALPPTASHGLRATQQHGDSPFDETVGPTDDGDNYANQADDTNPSFEKDGEESAQGGAVRYEYGQEDEAAPYDDGFDPDKDDVFEKVEEYDVTTPEHEGDNPDEEEAHSSGNLEQSASAPGSGRGDNGPAMAAWTEGSDSNEKIRRTSRSSHSVSERSTGSGRGSHRSDVFREAEAMVAADAEYLAPSESAKSPAPRRAVHPSGYPTALQYRQVPPTPPSPPTVAALVESFTARRHTAESVDANPVSTMAPSAGLFQKLISVWRSSEEACLDNADRGTNRLDSSLAAIYRGEQNVSQSTTQDSTLPSGDTDLIPPKAVHAESPRSRRRRAIRMEPGSPVHQDLQRAHEASTESGRYSADERGSIASFSDAFSSERDRSFLYTGQGEGYNWDEAIQGDQSAGIPLSSSASQDQRNSDMRTDTSREATPGRSRPPLPPSPRASRRKTKTTHSTSTHGTQGRTVATDGNVIRVDRRHLDWLTKELLNARDMLSRQELQMTFHETQRVEQEEVLLLDKQNAESVVGAMTQILADREGELKDARSRLSVAIDSVGTTTQARSSLASSRNSMSAESQNLNKLITEGHANLHSRFDESDKKGEQIADQMTKETRGLWAEVQRAMVQQMTEMTEKRDEELELLRQELEHRQNLIANLQKSSEDLRSKNTGFQSDITTMRAERQRADQRYQLEMAHVGAQVELVNEFSKKLHDNFRETENLRQQVLQYQDKLSHITSTSGVSQRQIKELREAVTRANDDCARLRREADLAKRKGMEAVRRAEELEELRHKDAAAHSASRFPDRQARTDSSSYRSHEPIRPAGQNRPGGSGSGARYHTASRSRGIAASPTPAKNAWLMIKDRIGGIVTGKESSSSRRRPTGTHLRRDPLRNGPPSQSSGSHSRSRVSPGGEDGLRSRSASVNSRSSRGSGSSLRSGGGSKSGSQVSPIADTRQYMRTSPRREYEPVRAANFL